MAETLITRSRTITEADIVNYAGYSGDFAPLHMDEEYARTTPFGGRILHGCALLAICNGLIVQDGLLDDHLAFLGCTFTLQAPTRPGDTVHVEAETSSTRMTSDGVREVVVYDVRVLNQRGETVMRSEWTLLREAAAVA